MKIPHLVLLAGSTLSMLGAPSSYHDQAKELVSRMTLEEKASLCSGRDTWSTKPIDRLGLASIVLTDGPHGVRRSRAEDPTNNLPATCFPTAPTLASSWNTALMEKVGIALGQEARALGVHVLLGPGVNMKRSPLGGRNFEYFSEDPVLAGKLAAAWIRGVQSQGVGASLKHFAANNQEHERMISNSVVDERTLNEIYLPAFEIAIREASPWTVMCSYNKLNGVPASQNHYLLTEQLRNKWGFQGIVISDWGAVEDRVAGEKAGLNLEMPSSGGIDDAKVVAAVISGELETSKLDEMTTGIVELILETDSNLRTQPAFDQEAHHELARKVAEESIVLLKNEHSLPIDPARKESVAIIGDLAKHPRFQGSGSSRVNPTRLDNSFDELAALLGKEHLSYAAAYDHEGIATEAELREAVTTASKADRAIVFVGLPDNYESEGFDRKNLGLPPSHDALVERIVAVQPNTTVVLMNGSAVTMPWIGKVKSVLEAYLTGQAGGSAIAAILTGRCNPSGKLAETFPQRIEDTPSYPNFPGQDGQALYGEGLFIGYRYYDAKKVAPLFPFGHGLSYTHFAYTAIKAEASSIRAAEGTRLFVTVKNTGQRKGAEVIQLYLHQAGAPVQRPEKELKHFEKIELAQGEEKTVEFQLTTRDFARYQSDVHDWVVDSGEFEVLVGSSSRELSLHQSLKVEGLPPVYPKLSRNSSMRDLGRHPKGRPIYDGMITQMLAAATKGNQAPRTPAEEIEARKARATLQMFLDEQTLGKLVMLSGGGFSEEMLQGILQSVNE
jgi:beta-glucosidase